MQRHGEDGQQNLDELGNTTLSVRVNARLISAIVSGAYNKDTDFVPYPFNPAGKNTWSVFAGQPLCVLKNEASIALGIGAKKDSVLKDGSVAVIGSVNGIRLGYDPKVVYKGVPDYLQRIWSKEDILRMVSFIGVAKHQYLDAQSNGDHGDPSDFLFPAYSTGKVSMWVQKLTKDGLAPNTKVVLDLPTPGTEQALIQHLRPDGSTDMATEFTFSKWEPVNSVIRLTKCLHLSLNGRDYNPSSSGNNNNNNGQEEEEEEEVEDEDDIVTKQQIRRNTSLQNDGRIGDQFVDGITGLFLLMIAGGDLNVGERQAEKLARKYCKHMINLQQEVRDSDKQNEVLNRIYQDKDNKLSAINAEYAKRSLSEIGESFTRIIKAHAEPIGTVIATDGVSADGTKQHIDYMFFK